MALMWYVLGALTVVIFWGVKSWATRRQVRLSLLSWCGVIVDTTLILFTFAWFLSSFAENEIQAARAGLIVFGGVSLIFIGLTRQLIKRDMNRR